MKIIKDKAQLKYIIKNIFRSDNRIKEFTENHLLLLIHLQEYTSFKNKINFTFNFMFEKLNITYHQLKKELYQCLVDLHDWGLININNIDSLDNVNQNTYILIDKINYDSNYTLVSAEEIDKILYSNLDVRLIKTMLYVYVVICSWIGVNDRSYCFPKTEDFKRDINTKSHLRITNSIQQLKKLGLIDYENVGVVRAGDKVYQANNIYVLTLTDNYKDVIQRALEESKFYYEQQI